MSDITSRVTMIWPTDLKDQVQELAGTRGMTSWVIAAVEQKLGTDSSGAAGTGGTGGGANDSDQEAGVDAAAPEDPDTAPFGLEEEEGIKLVHLVKVEDDDAQVQYDEDPELREVLSMAAASPTVAKQRERRIDVGAEVFNDGAPTLADIQTHYRVVPASELVPEEDRCPNCQEPLIDGSCWTCE